MRRDTIYAAIMDVPLGYAFSATKVVPGPSFSPDKMLQGRIFAYHDAHLYRVGTNYQQLPANRPIVPASNTLRDGSMRFDGNQGSAINYEPNSKGTPKEASQFTEQPMKIFGDAARLAEGIVPLRCRPAFGV